MDSPKDPMLRAIWLGCQQSDLTPTERLALLALWRFLKDQRKRIGPNLLGPLIGISADTARNVFTALKRKGYIGSAGGAKGRGKVAERWLTTKIDWPTHTQKRASADASKRASASATDQGVRQAGMPGTAFPVTPLSPAEHAPSQMISIADIVARTEAADPKS